MITTAPSTFCCGIVELGNFAYLKDKGPKGLPHYHKVGGWKTVGAAPGTTEAEIRSVVESQIQFAGGVICSTGADQEYLDDILPALGFTRTDFVNHTHEKGVVKFWFLAADKYVRAPMPPPPVKEKAAPKAKAP